MRLRELFEAPGKKVIAVMPGGFHPFHPGHKSLYDWATNEFDKANVYVAATNDTTSRPFPFDVKKKLAAMAGVPTQRFIQVKSPFNALSYQDIIGDAASTTLVFVRSEKDVSSHPKPDQVRKSDGMMGYLISWKGKADETADVHGYMAYGPTIDFDFSGMSIKSASELRAAWPEMSDEDKLQAAELMYPGNAQTASQLLDQALGVMDAVPAESVQESTDNDKLLKALKKKLKDEGGAAGFKPLKDIANKMDIDLTPTKLKSMPGIKQHRDGDYILEEVTPGQSLPKQIKVLKMPTPPQAPNGPDGTDENGTRIGTTPKGNRSVKSGAGTYIFTPKGKLMLYMTPKMGGLQQTHNIAKQTVTVNFGTSAQGATIDQKATYDMSGKLISGDNTSIKSGTMGVSVDKDKGATVDMTTLSGKKHSINSKDPKKYDKLAALKKDQDQDLDDFKKANTATLAKMGIKR